MHRSPPRLKQASTPTLSLCTPPARLAPSPHGNKGLNRQWGPSVAAGQEVQP